MNNADFLLAYGSHTGQAEAISKQIKEKAELLGWRPRLHELNDNEKKFELENEKLAVIVVSSTGDGDAPENCDRFLRRINRKTLSEKYLEGLGDSNYSTYQGVPRKIDKQLLALGAKKIIPTGEADDQVGLEIVAEPWMENLFKELATRFSVDPEKLATVFSSSLSFNPVLTKEEKDKIAATQKKSKEEMDNEQEMLIPEPYTYPNISLIKGNEKLQQDPNLRVPIAPIPYIISSVTHLDYDHTPNSNIWQNGAKMPGVISRPFDVKVVGTALLTDENASKPKRELVIDLGEHQTGLPYEPGDAFYFITPNPEKEVNFILDRLGLIYVADRQLKLSIHPQTTKINPCIPEYLPQMSSLRHLLTWCLDIRRAPGRPLLRIFAESASEESEKRRLLELCSAQGMNDFTSYVRQAGLSIADVLLAFPSVKPSVDRLFELLPRLIPRPYSVASAKGRRVRFIFSVLDFPAEDGRRYTRKGLATEWLLSLKVGDVVQIMAKEAARFRLPPPPLPMEDALSMPLLMIGPGTGVSVFLSFCQHLLKKKLENKSAFPEVPRYLYFGCRDFEKDYIYKDELESYVREGILTELIACESQGTVGRPKYVQDALKENATKVKEFIQTESHVPSRIFICGDAKGMSKDVFQCFKEIVENSMEKTSAEAISFLADLKKADRYVEDVWS